MARENLEAFFQIEKGQVVGFEEHGRIPLAAKPQFVGRVSEIEAADIQVKDDYISRKHIQITYSYGAGGFVIRDLNSLNGTELNGKRVAGHPLLLKDGDVIGMGIVKGEPRVIFQFRMAGVTLLSSAGPQKEGG